MYLEVEKRLNLKNKEAWRIKICENSRENGKPKKKTIRKSPSNKKFLQSKESVINFS